MPSMSDRAIERRSTAAIGALQRSQPSLIAVGQLGGGGAATQRHYGTAQVDGEGAEKQQQQKLPLFPLSHFLALPPGPATPGSSAADTTATATTTNTAAASTAVGAVDIGGKEGDSLLTHSSGTTRETGSTAAITVTGRGDTKTGGCRREEGAAPSTTTPTSSPSPSSFRASGAGRTGVNGPLKAFPLSGAPAREGDGEGGLGPGESSADTGSLGSGGSAPSSPAVYLHNGSSSSSREGNHRYYVKKKRSSANSTPSATPPPRHRTSDGSVSTAHPAGSADGRLATTTTTIPVSRRLISESAAGVSEGAGSFSIQPYRNVEYGETESAGEAARRAQSSRAGPLRGGVEEGTSYGRINSQGAPRGKPHTSPPLDSTATGETPRCLAATSSDHHHNLQQQLQQQQQQQLQQQQQPVLMRHLISSWGYRGRPPPGLDDAHLHHHNNNNGAHGRSQHGPVPNGVAYGPSGCLNMLSYSSHQGVFREPPPFSSASRPPSSSSSSSLLRNRSLFSSMPSLLGSKDTLDKKALKREKKREKEERRRLEKEEKKRRKQEKKLLASGTLPRNWSYVSRPIEDVYHRPSLRLHAVPIDFEDDHQQQQQYAVPVKSVPTTPTGHANFMLQRRALHASAPDLARVEQVYGTTVRRGPAAPPPPFPLSSPAPQARPSPKRFVL